MTITVRNVEFGSGIPKICIPLMPKTLEDIEKECKVLEEFDYDIIEWRMDHFQNIKCPNCRQKAVEQIRSLISKPLLATFRTSFEGGEMEVSKEEYLTINESIIASKCVDFVDVEAFIGDDVVEKIVNMAHEKNVYVIGSNHDFKKTPDYDEILNRLNTMKELGVDIPKVAYMPTSKEDVLTVLKATNVFTSKNTCPIITMSMGKEGMISRLSGEVFGSCLTFGAAKMASAPGQINAKDLKTILEIIHSSM